MSENLQYDLALEDAEKRVRTQMFKTVSSDDELVKAIRKVIDKDDADAEVIHRAADSMIINLIRGLGYAKTADLFESMEKWYA